ncbi:MAG TPA: beta-ketoacyl synthase chain length factor [Telluria sp.]
MRPNGITFCIESHAVWAAGLESAAKWEAWCDSPFPLEQFPYSDPSVSAMPAMLRRRAGTLGKMALEVAYACLDGRANVDTVFCSRHGDVARSLALLEDLVRGEPLSPTGFGMAVHNANAGLLSIARQDRAQHIALAGAAATLEHGLVEACGLIAYGAPRVLVVMADCPLPGLLRPFDDSPTHQYALGLMVAPASSPMHIELAWEPDAAGGEGGEAVPELHAMRFLAGASASHERVAGGTRWRWSRHA